MSRLRQMIADTETELRWSRMKRDATPGPRKFMEFDAVIAAIRLKALREAKAAIEAEA